MEIIGVVLNDDYDSALDEIVSIAQELKISKLSVTRQIICDTLGFMPSKEMQIYSRNHQKVKNA